MNMQWYLKKKHFMKAGGGGFKIKDGGTFMNIKNRAVPKSALGRFLGVFKHIAYNK